MSALHKIARVLSGTSPASSTTAGAAPPALSLPAPASSTSLPLPETLRVCVLPEITYQRGAYSESLHLPGARLRLFDLQAEAVEAMRREGIGLFGPIAAGRGKTAIAILAPVVLDCDFAIVLTKSGIVEQTRRAVVELSASFELRPLRIVSYSILSHKQGSRLLEDTVSRFDPARVVIVCDEAHSLASPSSARTRRVLRFARAFPAVRWVMLSGTLLRRSIRDVAHLAELALRDRSPLPAAGVYGARATSHLEAWSECIDPDGRPAPEAWNTIAPLGAFGGVDLASLRGAARVDAVRACFAARLRTCPGVVMSLGDGVEAALRLRLLDEPKPPASVDEALRVLAAHGEDPDGDIVPDDLGLWRKARELAAGYFYRWIWPGGEVDQAWLDARKAWNRAVRTELEARASVDYDSPLLVSERVVRDLEAAARGERIERRAVHSAWSRWSVERRKKEPDTTPVWISSYLVDHALELALSHGRPVIVWYGSRAVEEALRASKRLPVYGSGDELPEAPAHTCAASWKVHGTGRNLQAWNVSILLELPDGGDAWEQLLARMHRTGQKADEVLYYVYQHTESYRRNLRSAEDTERFVSASLSSPRRLIYADREDHNA